MAGRSPASILYDSSGNAVGVILDGSVYRLQALSKILNSSGTQIDPATQGTLASIKDTDGIKKITDAVAVTDNAGSLTVDTPQLPSALVGGRLDENIGAWLGSTVPTVGQKTMANSIPIVLSSDQSAIEVKEIQEATFIAHAPNVAIAGNKSMLALYSTTASYLTRLHGIWVRNVQTTAVTGVNANFELRRATGVTGGTAVTPIAYDTSDSVSGITCTTGGSIVGEVAALLDRYIWSSDEHGAGTLDQEGHDKAFQMMFPTFFMFPKLKPLVLRNGECIHLKQTTGSANGTFDIRFLFSQVSV